VISGNGLDGIVVSGAGASNNVMQGNYVGTTKGGTDGLRNGRAGIGIYNARNNTIGGAVAGEGNVVSANAVSSGSSGIYLISTNATLPTTGNTIQGNKIGTDGTGIIALPNAHEGIYLERAHTNTIGGPAPGEGNLISGNNTWGVFLTNSTWNLIQGNMIGTKADGVSGLGNAFHAVECESNAFNNTIGGVGSAANRIAFSRSGFAGVRIRDGATNNLIRGNAIFSNSGLGIDLGASGVTADDACDGDTGANMLQNYPVLTQAVSGNGTGIRGTLNSKASSAFLLQFFANASCDGSGNGEGEFFLGEITVTTSSGCNTNFVATLPLAAPVGYMVTATATDAANNTSEFSTCMAVVATPSLGIARTNSNQVALTWTNTTTGFVLKQADTLLPPIPWTTVTNVPSVVGGQFLVTLSPGVTNRFYLLSFE
jgi:hypothetical protein